MATVKSAGNSPGISQQDSIAHETHACLSSDTLVTLDSITKANSDTFDGCRSMINTHSDDSKPTFLSTLSMLHGLRDDSLLSKSGAVLSDIFEATSKLYPHTTALEYGERTLTYYQLNCMSSIAAARLVESGVAGPNKLIGLWMSRGIESLVMQLAITKSGSAWLPFDVDTPLDRIMACLSDSHASGIVVESQKQSLVEPYLIDNGLKNICQVLIDIVLLAPSLELSEFKLREILPNHAAYVIYTSGSTGKPKGISITHKSITHFLRSENSQLGVRHGDRVYQGFSVAFDMSFEEIWISYLVGATLWIAPKEIAYNPEEIPLALISNNITVFHSVPTLLSLFEKDVPSLRIINLGGEMCPESLVIKWASSSERKVFNTYGPTEATVSASIAQLKPSEPVTIGIPLPNYNLCVIDSNLLPQLKLVARGVPGELCITGPGVSNGYLGRPELTAEKFLRNPWAESDDAQDATLYRTGDLACIDAEGRVHCMGRVDDQVKIRGYRVELGEIEAIISKINGVGTVAVVLSKDGDIDVLIAYIVVKDDDSDVGRENLKSNISEWRQTISKKLPAYMIPSRFEVLESMPRLASGKIDRSVLKTRYHSKNIASISDLKVDTKYISNSTEMWLYKEMQLIFPGQSIQSDTDFFTDLGGNSLLAARLASAMRAHSKYSHTSIRDIYICRTFSAIANSIHQYVTEDDDIDKYNLKSDIELSNQKDQFQITIGSSVWTQPPIWKYYLCGLCQFISIIIFSPISMVLAVGPYFIYSYYVTYGLWAGVLSSLAIFISVPPVFFLFALIAKWVIIGRVKPGRYPLWGVYYFRLWLGGGFVSMAPSGLLSGTSLLPIWLRLLGAEIGDECEIGNTTVSVPDCIKIGDNVSLGHGASLSNFRVERGEIIIGRIEIGDDCYIGSYSILEGNTKMEKWAHLEGQSVLMDGMVATEGRVWNGSPAVDICEFDRQKLPPRISVSNLWKAWEMIFFIFGALFIAIVFFLPVYPTFLVYEFMRTSTMGERLFGAHLSFYHMWAVNFAIGLPATMVLMTLTALISCCLRWMVLPRMKEGIYPTHSWIFLQSWLVDAIHASANIVFHGIYATVYAPIWYRLMGAKVGKDAELSKALGIVPELLTLGDETFVADYVLLDNYRIDGGFMQLGAISLGHRSFIGNQAYVKGGTHIPENVLIGVRSSAPDSDQFKRGDTWVGNLPVNIPVREVLKGFPEHLTYKPNLFRRISRAMIEMLRIIFPTAFTISYTYTILRLSMTAVTYQQRTNLFLLLFLSIPTYALSAFTVVALIKWIFIFRYKQSSHPMATFFVWISEGVTSIFEALVVPLLTPLVGTPLLPILLRVMGCKIGKGVYMGTLDITEFDCIEIGDFSEINAGGCLQTHLFEDRVMKIDQVKIGRHVTIRAGSTVLYGAYVEDGAMLGPLTLVMKGEVIPENSEWGGCPAAPLVRRCGKM